jgi:hypothetical protein
MKYIITENRMVGIIEKYIQDRVGKLRKYPTHHINARDGDYEFANNKGETIFRLMDHDLGVDEPLYLQMLSLFNLNDRELEELIKLWFKTHYPDSLILSVYPLV